MIEKYEIHGYLMPVDKTEWLEITTPIGIPTDDLNYVEKLLRNSNIEHFIIEVRRNPSWVEFSPSQTFTDSADSGSKSRTSYNRMTGSTSSETQSTEGPTDMT